MRDFHDLQVWQKSHSLTLGIYRVSGAFPPQEIYGLSSQIRRAAASIPANLAEGCGRNGNAELLRFCSIAMGSASELEYHLLLIRDLHFITATDYDKLHEQTIELKRMLAGLQKSLNADR
ncbi:MAG: four helix bundle protein [Acidobacteria bacterium]|nr:four helix bundle protein [Acidobacteriota bacterium]